MKSTTNSTWTSNRQAIEQPDTSEIVWRPEMPQSKTVDREFVRQAPKDTTTVMIPDGVEVIHDMDNSVFNELIHLKRVFIPSSVNHWVCAFSDCRALEEVILEEGIARIDEYAFRGCVDLKRVKLPKQLSKIGRNAFQNCTSLETLETEEGTECEVEEIGRGAFHSCKSLKDLGDLRIAVIQDSALGRSGIERIVSNCRDIGAAAFFECAELKEVVMPSPTLRYYGHFIMGCDKLELLVLSDDNVQFSGNEQAALEERAFIGIQEGGASAHTSRQ